MSYSDKLIAEWRNDVNHKNTYTHKCRCWGKCYDKVKRKILQNKEKYKTTFLKEVSYRYPDRYYYGPERNFSVRENGIWTTITCPICGYQETWSVGDGNERF